MNNLIFRIGAILAVGAWVCGAGALTWFLSTTPAWPIALIIGPLFLGLAIMAISTLLLK